MIPSAMKSKPPTTMEVRVNRLEEGVERAEDSNEDPDVTDRLPEQMLCFTFVNHGRYRSRPKPSRDPLRNAVSRHAECCTSKLISNRRLA
jgi:hypothetical protein